MNRLAKYDTNTKIGAACLEMHVPMTALQCLHDFGRCIVEESREHFVALADERVDVVIGMAHVDAVYVLQVDCVRIATGCSERT